MLIALYVILSLAYWPITLFLNVQENNLINFLFPPALLLATLTLYKKDNSYFLLPVLVIPFISPKLSLFPVLFSLFFLFVENKKKLAFTALAASLIISFINWNSFAGQTIFNKDYEAEQKIIRDTQLYDSIFLARTFHNKARIYIDKFNYNFFALTDLNNYFFGNHPRQIPGAQNRERFPFLSVVFFLYGLYNLRKNRDYFFIINTIISGVFSLSVLTVFDGNDFILWFPLALIIIHGLHFFSRLKYHKIILLIILFFTFIDYVRIFILS